MCRLNYPSQYNQSNALHVQCSPSPVQRYRISHIFSTHTKVLKKCFFLSYSATKSEFFHPVLYCVTLLNIKYILKFCTNFDQIFKDVKRIQRNITVNVDVVMYINSHSFHCSIKLKFSRYISKSSQMSNFRVICPLRKNLFNV